MNGLGGSLAWLDFVDERRRPKSSEERLHPAAALLAMIAFLATVVSFDRLSFLAPLPLLAYPLLVFILSGLPARLLLKPLLLIEPFIICVGVLQPILDRRPIPFAGGEIAEGWLILVSLTLKCTLAASAALLLAATQGMERLAQGLRRLGVPRLFVLQLILTHRYLGVILEEARRLSLAAFLRSGGGRPRIRDWGSLAGGLLIRTCNRAERIHLAMRLRGFSGDWPTGAPSPFAWGDFAHLAGWLSFFWLVRFHNLPVWLGESLLGTAAA